MLRSHGMVRECDDAGAGGLQGEHPQLNPDFIFVYPAYNVRTPRSAASWGAASSGAWTPTWGAAPPTCIGSWSGSMRAVPHRFQA